MLAVPALSRNDKYRVYRCDNDVNKIRMSLVGIVPESY